MKHPRTAVAVLALSAAGFVGIAMNEGYSDRAIIPVPGDVPTIGLGSTKRDDGSPVQMTDRITPQKAIRRSVKDIGKDEKVLRNCFSDAELYQHEWDAYVDLSYNVGAWGVCRSSIVPKVKSERYVDACNTILDFKKVQGRDCSLPENKGFCGGVWERRLKINRQCLTGEYPE